MSVQRPEKTKIELVTAPGMLTASIPAKGIFSVWGILVVIGCGALALSVVPFVITIDLFPLFGLVFLLMGIQSAYRRTAIVVAGGCLTISFTGPLKKFEKTWEQDGVEWIKIGPSNVTVNNQKLSQLQVIDRNMKNEGFLTGWSDAELEWLADQIRSALGLTSEVTSALPAE
jgi:hypothetical protein